MKSAGYIQNTCGGVWIDCPDGHGGRSGVARHFPDHTGSVLNLSNVLVGRIEHVQFLMDG